MPSPMLRSVTLSDFRSISGTVTVPLDAPVVLIHGPNGAGKTSLLSGIELAATGDIPALRRTDSNYLRHLVHRDAQSSRVSLSTSAEYADFGTGELSVERATLKGEPLFVGRLSQFYGERCYLAQASLGRLLELYQDASTNDRSPLTQFVEELLRLDELEALTSGLHPALHLARTRRLVPEYEVLEARRSRLSEERIKVGAELASVSAEAEALSSELERRISELPSLDRVVLAGSDESAEKFDQEAEQSQVELTGLRRSIEDLRQRLAILPRGAEAENLSDLEEAARASEADLQAWLRESGAVLQRGLDELRDQYPTLGLGVNSTPGGALREALEELMRHLRQSSLRLLSDDRSRQRLGEFRASRESARARLALVDARIASLTANSDALSQILTDLIPHIDSEDCPVCGRDFEEVSSGRLVERVAKRAAKLSGEAESLRALAEARAAVLASSAQSDQDLELTDAQLMSASARSELITEIANLERIESRLQALQGRARAGDEILRRNSEIRRDLEAVRRESHESASVRLSISDMYDKLYKRPLPASQSNALALDEMADAVRDQQASLTLRQALRSSARRVRSRLEELEVRRDRLRSEVSRLAEGENEARSAFAEFEGRREALRSLSRTAVRVRTEVVRNVFNGSLNSIWRDLFVRLAPSEPFVPAFHVPAGEVDRVLARLETVHRQGGLGGTPGAMLSAGNLNTAALTLFLSLHLSVADELPVLVLDDPVQSMDDVHISQFAALLRTLSKEHGRQVIIAVHDRTLFDYLALELSPGSPSDRLITIELSRRPGRPSMAEPTYVEWEQDLAVVAS